MGRRIKRTLPNSQPETMGYDLAGNLVRSTNFNGVIITNLYDSLNRLTARTSANGFTNGFSYTSSGKRKGMVDASGKTSYTYDKRDRLQTKQVSWVGVSPITLDYSYDSNGNLTGLGSTSSGGVTNFFQFDPLNRLTNVLASAAAAAVYGYDGAGNLQALKHGNGVTATYQYDPLNRLTNLVWQLGSSNLAKFYYQLASAGSRTNLNEVLVGTSRTDVWTYDSLYRLTGETLSGGTVGGLTYGYDLVGNRTSRTTSGSLTSILTNQTFTFTSNDGISSDTYDNNGNTTASSGNSYSFDPLNHLTTANSSTYFYYDGDGNRAIKISGGTTNFYLIDDRNPSGYPQALEEWTKGSGSATLNRLYNYGLQPISQKTGSTTYYFAQDGHGSVRELIDTSGVVAQWFVFDAYGTLIASKASPATPILYCGECFDSRLGAYYLRARVFNEALGRFVTLDTFVGSRGLPQSLHKYLYCNANPVNGTDPNGLWSEIPSFFSAGKAAEDPVVLDFRNQVGNADAAVLRSIHGILDFASKTGYRGVGRLIPDLVNTRELGIYDVKSWKETAAGMEKIQAYVVAFNDADPDPTRAGKWHSGLSYEYAGPNPVALPGVKSNGKQVFAKYFKTEAGVVPYKLYEVDNEDDAKRIPIDLPVPYTSKDYEEQYRTSPYPVGELIYASYYTHVGVHGVALVGGAAITTYVGIATLTAMGGAP
jgi:RHS repeat-associated protein